MTITRGEWERRQAESDRPLTESKYRPLHGLSTPRSLGEIAEPRSTSTTRTRKARSMRRAESDDR